MRHKTQSKPAGITLTNRGNMVKQIKEVGTKTKRNVQIGYEVLAMAAAVAASVRVSTLPEINNLPFWQIVGGVILAGVVVKVFILMAKEV